LGFFLGLTNTQIYEDFSHQTEVFEFLSEPYDLTDAEEREKDFTLEYPSDGEFTILWGTDFHLRLGPFNGQEKVYALLEKAFAFGNHDGQYHHDRDTLGDMLSKYPHALFSRGEEWVLGESDYIIALTHQGEVVQSLVMVDSHDSRIYEGGKGPDYIYPSQIAWYEWVAQGLAEVPLYAFFHIPLPEFTQLWQSGQAIGVMNDRMVNFPWENSGLFQTMVEGGTTVAIFCSHDYLNDFHGLWEGIALHTGLSASYGSYGSITHAKGVKTITLSKNNPTMFVVKTYTVDEWGL